MLHDSAMAPWRLTLPKVGRRPVTPHLVDGETIEPQVSEPIAETHQTGGGRRSRSRRRPARSLLGVPGVAGRLAVPDIAPGERPEGELGDEHRARLVELGDDGRVLVDHLVFEGLGAPGRGIAAHRQEVLGAPRDAVQRPPPDALGKLAVGAARLFEGALFGQSDDAVQLRVEGLEAIEVEERQLFRCDGPRPQEVAELGHRQQGEFRVTLGSSRQLRPTGPGNQRPIRKRHPRQQRLELQGRRHRVVDRDRPQRSIVLPQVLEPFRA